MELRQILYFVRVAEQRSFSRAAELLGVSQPSLSRQVQQLEIEAGTHLLVRNGRGVEPTEAGRRMLDHGKALLDMADRALADVRDRGVETTGKVVIGLPARVAHAITPLLVARFREALPRAAITVAEGLSAQLRESLLAERLELAVLYDPAPSPQLVFESLYREPLVLAASAATSARLPRSVSVSSLARYPLVVPSQPNAIRSLLERACRRQGVVLDIVAEVDAVGTLRELAARGQAYTVLPRSAVAGVAELRMARIVKPDILNDLVLATPAKRPGTRLAQATARLLRELDIGQALG